jgi:site-specific DNA-adenine methylase
MFIKPVLNGRLSSGWSYGIKLKPKNLHKKIESTLSEIHKRLKNVYIDHLDFRRCIKNWDSPSTFFFMDPPYYKTGQANKLEFTEDDFRELAKICGEIQGKFLITVNDAPFIRETFKDFKIEPIQAPCFSQAITKASKLKTKGSYVHLLISNY